LVTYSKAGYHQRFMHFTDELSFVSESDKDWATGHAALDAPEREGATK
jgi:hypothetical protein